MQKRVIVTGLDIGSSKTAAVMASGNRQGGFEILAHVNMPSKGVSKGTITDIGEATDSVSAVLSRLRERSRLRPANIYVNMSGASVKGARSTGMIPVAIRGREVTKHDMERSSAVASTIHLPFDREILHRVVRSYSVDDQPWVRNPAGLYASRLACEVFVITADVNHIQNAYKCVNGAGYDIKALVYSGIADASAILDEKDAELGTMLIDIGDSLTEISVFSGGALADLEVLDMGSRDVSGDFRQSDGFNKVVDRIAAKSQESVRSGSKISSAILTGGMVFADGLIEYLEGKLQYPIKMGVAKDIRGDISSIDSLRLSTSIGLARYGYGIQTRKACDARTAAHRLSEKIVDIFNNYF